jgi:hypothetical protein
MKTNVQLCDELIYDFPVRQCTHPAKYKYQATLGHASYLCGIHARRLQGSAFITPYPGAKKGENQWR